MLYQHKDEGISIQVEAKFENGELVIEGYDIGSTVKDVWGDSDYEYSLRVRKADIELVCRALKITSCDEASLLQEIARKFNGNYCFSEFQKFLDSNKIKYEGFSWT